MKTRASQSGADGSSAPRTVKSERYVRSPLIVLLLLVAPVVFGQTEPKAEPKPAESALVKAAKDAKKNRAAAKGKKVITNADVKKSKGKLIVLPGKPPAAAPAPADGRSTIEKHEEKIRDRQKAQEQVAVSEKKVEELARELLRLEQAFYDANDPNYRDGVIQKRFEQTKRQLDEARKDLADARDAATALDQPPS